MVNLSRDCFEGIDGGIIRRGDMEIRSGYKEKEVVEELV